MVPWSGTHPPSQDLLLPTGDPVGKLLGQRSGKGVLRDQVVLVPTPTFRDTSGPLSIRTRSRSLQLAGSTEALN